MGAKSKARAAAAEESLRVARITIDRMTVERATLMHWIEGLEEECEALRKMISRVAKGGEGAAL